MSIFIGGAWPSANGSLHLGHIASLLPGDILARYYRLKGEDVLYLSGSDCHGTPITLRAKEEGLSPSSISDRYHQEFVECFKRLGFSYDLYTRTDNEFHHQLVQKIFLELLEKGYVFKKEVEQIFCEKCEQFLPDRYLEGICPYCGDIARGDQCDSCSALIDALELKEKKCKICGHEPLRKKTEHFYFALSKFQENLSEYLETSSGWRDNALKLTERYLKEGLIDRAVTRDLDWGINVPIEGYQEKKIYVWIEAVLGYYTASKQWSKEQKKDWQKFWQEDVKAYYVHGKDNIPFHTIILPALLKGLGDLHLPDHIISSEYLNIEGKKLSTSKNWAVWASDILERYHPDSIRYYLTINAPEKRDSNFSWEEFINSYNGELLAAYGNFVNRTLVFVEKYFQSEIPGAKIDQNIKENLIELYKSSAGKIEKGNIKFALEEIFDFIRKMNKYYDEERPWITRKEDIAKCKNTIYSCVQSIVNLSIILHPFLPFSSEILANIFDIDISSWQFKEVNHCKKLTNVEILFERIDKETINQERDILLKQFKN
ncbi:methionine--tRNA ligase [Natronospora cellulosivora (SeqCode)]